MPRFVMMMMIMTVFLLRVWVGYSALLTELRCCTPHPHLYPLVCRALPLKTFARIFSIIALGTYLM